MGDRREISTKPRDGLSDAERSQLAHFAAAIARSPARVGDFLRIAKEEAGGSTNIDKALKILRSELSNTDSTGDAEELRRNLRVIAIRLGRSSGPAGYLGLAMKGALEGFNSKDV